MSHNQLYFGLFLVIFVAIIVAIILGHGQKKPYSDINSFGDCVKAGYPVINSDIEQCSLPNGKIFVNQVVQGR